MGNRRKNKNRPLPEKTGLAGMMQRGDTKLLNGLLIIFIVIFYGNVVYNTFALDDKYINTGNPQTSAGIKAIPDIFTSFYSHESGNAYGYRPLVRVSYALEYQFTKNYTWNPYFSHFINLLLYIIGVLILFRLLRRLLNGYTSWVAFFIALLYLMNPTHTEVVASLKNRDILLEFIFAFEAIWLFVRWADTGKNKYLYWGAFSYLLALLSKESAVVHLAVFPLVLYFFTDIPLKKLVKFGLGLAVIGLSVFLAPVVLFDFERNFGFIENPLFYEDNFFNKLATAFYILGFYLKQTIVPFPLRYYYGYNTIPVTNWADPVVWLSLVFYVGIFVVALKNLKQKKIISFIILFYLVHLSMYANIVMPVPGIVGDRFLFFASLSFAWLLVWVVVEYVLPYDLHQKRVPLKWLILPSFLALLYVAPAGYWVHIRNKQWYSEYTLYMSDMPYLKESVKANDLWAGQIMKRVGAELQKSVNPYHFIKKAISTAEYHFNKALELDSTFYSAWLNLGSIYSKIHGYQASLRYQAYMRRNDTVNAAKSEKEMKEYFKKAHYYFNQARKYRPGHANGLLYYNIAKTYEMEYRLDSAEFYYKKAIAIDSTFIGSRSKLANVYFKEGKFQQALKENEQIMKMEPGADIPYINMGNYYISFGDTATAIKYFEKAIVKGTRPEVGKLLSKFYTIRGDKQKAAYYRQKAEEAKKTYDPNKYSNLDKN
jgi:tetratricopeptide (TPR) repeat protein